MSKEINNDKTDKVMEAYYKYIGEAHIENIVKELKENREEIERVQVPEILNEWFHDYVKKGKQLENKKKRIRFMKQISSRAAIIILVLIAFMSIITFTVEAVRVKVFNFFMETNEEFTEVRVEEEGDTIIPNIEWQSYYYPTYLPKGYVFCNNDEFGPNRVLYFTNSNNQIQFVQAKNGTDFQLDTEDATTIEIEINGNKGFLVVEDAKTLLFWNNSESSFYLLGQISKEEIVDIAKSIEKK